MVMKDMKFRRSGYKINARVARTIPFESIETIEGRARMVRCEITNEGRNYLASMGVGNASLLNYVEQPLELAQFLIELDCVKETHYNVSRQLI